MLLLKIHEENFESLFTTEPPVPPPQIKVSPPPLQVCKYPSAQKAVKILVTTFTVPIFWDTVLFFFFFKDNAYNYTYIYTCIHTALIILQYIHTYINSQYKDWYSDLNCLSFLVVYKIGFKEFQICVSQK